MDKKSGQGLIEYLILVCLIAVSTIVVVSVVGLNIKEQYANISASLHEGKQRKPTEVDEGLLKKPGMGSFADETSRAKP